MSDIKDLAKEMPLTESSFTIDVEGDITKKRYVGEFTCKIPRRKEHCLIDKHRAYLNGDVENQLSPATLKFHHMIAYLRYTLKDFPKFWRETDLGYELYDANVVVEVYNKVLEFETEWLTKVWGKEAIEGLKEKSKES